MRKLQPGEYVTSKKTTAAERLLVYYHRYYRRGNYGEQYRGKDIRFAPGLIGKIRARCPSVFENAKHEEFLVIDFYEPITRRLQCVALHDSEVRLIGRQRAKKEG